MFQGHQLLEIGDQLLGTQKATLTTGGCGCLNALSTALRFASSCSSRRSTSASYRTIFLLTCPMTRLNHAGNRVRTDIHVARLVGRSRNIASRKHRQHPNGPQAVAPLKRYLTDPSWKKTGLRSAASGSLGLTPPTWRAKVAARTFSLDHVHQLMLAPAVLIAIALHLL